MNMNLELVPPRRHFALSIIKTYSTPYWIKQFFPCILFLFLLRQIKEPFTHIQHLIHESLRYIVIDYVVYIEQDTPLPMSLMALDLS